MENRASRYSIPERFRSIKSKAVVGGGALLTAALLACSSGDADTSPTPGPSIKPPGTGSEQIIPPPEPTPTIEQSLVNYANKFLKPEFQIGDIGLVEGKPNDKGGIEYTRKIEKPDGMTFTLSRTNSPDGSLQTIYVLIDGILVPDPPSGSAFPSASNVTESFSRYFNVQEINPESLTRRSTDQGRVHLWEITTDNPDGSFNTLSAYAYHPRGNNSVIGVSSCHVTPASSTSRTCFAQ